MYIKSEFGISLRIFQLIKRPDSNGVDRDDSVDKTVEARDSIEEFDSSLSASIQNSSLTSMVPLFIFEVSFFDSVCTISIHN